MGELTERTLREIEKKFKKSNGYVGQWDGNNSIYCPQVNGLINICLMDLGFLEKARINSKRFLNSPSFDVKRGLFFREVGLGGDVVVSKFNTCKNATQVLSLAACRFTKEANKLMDNLQSSPLFFSDHDLFGREYDPDTNGVNSLLITQSNLWVALAYLSLGRRVEAKNIIKSLESERYSTNCRLFNSQDCRGDNYLERFFADDQALAILVYLELGEFDKAKDLAEATLKSSLYDLESGLFNSSFYGSDTDTTKSTYKNSLMAKALWRVGYRDEVRRIQEGLIRELYDANEGLFNQTTKDSTKVPDNSMLALVALGYDAKK